MPFTLSVVIPTYNRRATLGRCLESVFRQTRAVDQVIVVDDGSTDGTEDWIRSSFANINLVTQTNQGVSAARNTGIQTASSQWIAFLDSDDVWLPTKIEKQIALLKANPEYKICHTEEKWIYQGSEKKIPASYRKRNGWIFEHCLPVCAISPSTAVIHCDLFDTVGLFDENLPACEDYDLWLRITASYPVALVDEPLIEKHGGQPDQLSNQRGLDAYRIQALEKLLLTKSLNPAHRSLAIETLQSKCAILAKGAEKQGRAEEANRFRSISSQY